MEKKILQFNRLEIILFLIFEGNLAIKFMASEFFGGRGGDFSFNLDEQAEAFFSSHL